MKNLGRIFLIAIFVIPILVCAIAIRNIWKEDDDTLPKKNSPSGVIVSIGDTVYTSRR